MQVEIAPPSIPVGQFKTFGRYGPAYEIIKPLRQLEDGDWMVDIVMVETGEHAEYRLTSINDDPDAH
ncbi:DUF5397 family protein [Roseateles sp. LYH14W]|uniref:DUF5397 family protein n=1 Tax=Pelomonas parva TaxID=3299032 RepID=A0ABW7F810_9BURK